MTNLTLFGPLHIEQDGKPLALGARKAQALLAYLAITGQPQSRETLATLLWPDYGQSEALGHLRRELLRLRKLIGHEAFQADRKEISLVEKEWWIDVVHFQQLVADADGCGHHSASDSCPICREMFSQAATLHSQDLLAGLTIPDSPDFDEWHYFQTEGLRQTLARILAQLAQGHAEAEEFDTAITHARRLVSLDPLHEAAHRELMILYTQSDQHAAALRQYESCVRTLEKELDAPPAAATTELYEAIRTRTYDKMTRWQDDKMKDTSSPHPVIQSSGHLVTKPPPHTLPTITEPFVGREDELKRFSQELGEKHLVVISGMAGVGKTMLATVLARQSVPKEQIFWHTFRPNEGADALLWQLAAFLAEREQDDLWRLLQTTQQTGAKLPPIETLIDYLIEQLKDQPYLLCFDDLHLVEENPTTAQAIERFVGLTASGTLSLIVTSRRQPFFAIQDGPRALEGLTLDDTSALLQVRNVLLADEFVRQLHQKTDGNAQFLVLAIQALNQSPDPIRLLTRLATADNIERYLFHQINAHLSADEQKVLAALSIQLGYPATRDAIEAILDGPSARNALRTLTDAHLVASVESPIGREFQTHAMVSAFYYDGLSRRERQTLHARAGNFYAHESPDPFRSAQHYEQAGESVKAAQQATKDIRKTIGLGRIQPMRQLLERLPINQLDEPTAAAVHVALGQIYPQLDEWSRAQQCYETALDLVKNLPDSQPETLSLHAEICLGMAGVAERDSFDKAMSWAKRGLAHLSSADPMLAAALHIKRAGFCAVLGDFETGVRAIEMAQAHLNQRTTPEPHVLQAAALENLGVLYFHQGYAKEAGDQWQQSLDICRKLPDPFKAVNLLNNLGAFNLVAGQWPEAGAFLEEGLAEAERIGLLFHQSAFRVNLGILAIWQGNDEVAERHLLSCAEQTSEFGTNALYSLADLRLRQKRLAEAAELLTEAESQAHALETSYQLAEIYTLWAQLNLAEGNVQTAENFAKRAVTLAQEFGMTREAGIAHSVHGQVLAVQNKPSATAAFEGGLALLADSDPYALARTQMALGQSLLESGHLEDGQSHIISARNTFITLGAQRELDAIAA